MTESTCLKCEHNKKELSELPCNTCNESFDKFQAKQPEQGMKFDNGKPKWNLVIHRFLTGLVRALEHGAVKYAPHSWQTVPNATERYFSALKRHYDDLQRNDGTINLNAIDKDSGLPCTNLILANAYFLEGLRVIKEDNSSRQEDFSKAFDSDDPSETEISRLHAHSNMDAIK